MSDLTEFLLARIAEDEALVGRFVNRGVGEGVDAWGEAATDYFFGAGSPCDPSRVLAECAAKRAIVEMWAVRQEQDHLAVQAHATGLGLAIRALAAAYSDHPDYQPEWRP